MKIKNDAKRKMMIPAEIVPPEMCSNCQHDDLRAVMIGAKNYVAVINLEAYRQKSFWGRLWTRFNPLYGWHCGNCGHIMLFTTRTLK